MNNLISLHNVGKKYANRYILQEVTIDVNSGDSIVFTGHNGTGKSTLLNIVGNLVKSDTGTIRYMPNIRISYVPEHFPKMNISASAYVENMAQIQGLTQVEAKRKSTELFEAFYMSNMIQTPIKYLSKGTLQKVAVIQALLVKSDVLLLDEPLSGQDSDSQRYFIQYVKQLNKEGTAIVMSCHEKWLMNTLSKTVYEIEDKTLVKRNDISERSLEYVLMSFDKGERLEIGDVGSSVKIEELVLKIEKQEQLVEIYAKRENSKMIVLKMMEAGYELRRMTDERMD
ncbi:ABC transporter ATP-binding protein [Anaerosporobacter sp.]|uniref:ABC transporter ATP-binding protein n=1 Tax=Anaerosporobacter sp. TaxID=1872529 RepID=UPI00286EB96F|nr:ABC transporter ATP-binding protein [Anaerosporobacter sp.]